MDRDYESKMDYSNFDDMKKYNPNFSEEQIKNKTDEEIRTMFKEYYSEHLPVDLLTWMRVYEPKNEMGYKKGYWNQTVFIRDEINRMFYSKYEDYKANPVKVISTHRSKSIILPVYYIFLEGYNTKIIIRNNFYDWKISIDSKYSITGIEEFFKEKEPVNPRTEVLEVADWWCCDNRVDSALRSPYLDWYKQQLKKTYDDLNKAGIITRKVIFR